MKTTMKKSWTAIILCGCATLAIAAGTWEFAYRQAQVQYVIYGNGLA